MDIKINAVSALGEFGTKPQHEAGPQTLKSLTAITIAIAQVLSIRLAL